MLRRKLLSRIGMLIGAFVTGAVIAIVLLQSVVSDVERVNNESALLVDGVQNLSASIASLDAAGDDEARARALDAVRESMDRLGAHPIVRPPDGEAAVAFARVRERLDPVLAGAPASIDPALQAHLRDLGRIVGRHVAAEHTSLGRYFRLLVLGLTIAAIIMVNVSVIVLLRIVYMILRPVDQLAAASHELAHERFDHRVSIERDDEFGELAHVFNRMAERLEANEERKMDTLRQVAVTLNHGLNNAINGIELQLQLADREADANSPLKQRLERIHESLAGMTQAVQALAHVRRIVLTEYMPGQLMLDLQRSVEDDPLEVTTTNPPSTTAGNTP